MVYFGASYGASDFGGNMYFNFALTSLVEIPATFLAIDNCERYMHIILIVWASHSPLASVFQGARTFHSKLVQGVSKIYLTGR